MENLQAHSNGTAPASVQEAQARVMSVLETVTDPEVPVLSLPDLGVIRMVDVFPSANSENGLAVRIAITPTYTGCPAIDVMKMNIRIALAEQGFREVIIEEVLSPAWTTDWMTESGKQKLKAYGIAPPHQRQSVCTPDAFQEEEAVECPQCGSYHTRLVSRFGSTACKALYQCDNCKEPFDYFKCH